MLEQIVLGIIQGVTEWLPLSSEGVLILTQIYLFGGQDLSLLVRTALFLHLGTFLAALIYFRKDIWNLVKVIFEYKNSGIELKKIFWFLIVSTIGGGLIGGFIVFFVLESLGSVLLGRWATIGIGLLLLITAFMQFRANKGGFKEIKDLNFRESIILGVVQGLSVLPGISRSGITISTFLLRRFNKTLALKLSFLMSLPVVFGANIVLGLKDVVFSSEMFIGLVFSFVFGLLTIHGLLKLSEKINFAWFVLIFGILAIVAGIFI